METELAAARVACQNKDYSKAVALLEPYLQRNQDDGPAWVMFGLALDVVANNSAAVAALEHASLLIPLQPLAQIRLAIGYRKIGRSQLSRDLLERLITHPAITAELLLEIAGGLDAVGAPDLAAHACREATSCDPQLAQPYYDLGYYASKCGCPPEFVVSFANKAISLEPLNINYRIGLAALLTKLSRGDEAYRVVKDLSDAQIEAIDCACCLERVLVLYQSSSDHHRVVLCQRQLLQLTVATSSSSAETKIDELKSRLLTGNEDQ